MTPSTSGEPTFVAAWKVTRHHLGRLALLPLAAGGITYAATYLVDPKFTSSVSFLPPNSQTASALLIGAALGQSGGLGGLNLGSLLSPAKSQGDQWVAMLKGPTISNHIIEKYELMEVYGETYRKDTRDTLADRVSIETTREGIIQLSVLDTSPERAVKIANEYVVELDRLNSNLVLSDAKRRRLFFEGYRQRVILALDQAQANLKRTEINQSELRTNSTYLSSQISTLQAALAEQEAKVAVLRNQLTHQNPILISELTLLNEIRKQLASVLQSDKNEPTNTNSEPKGSTSFADQFRSYKYQEALLEAIEKQLQMARLDEASSTAPTQIIDPPEIAEKKTSPKRGLITVLMAALLEIALISHLLVKHGVWGKGKASAA